MTKIKVMAEVKAMARSKTKMNVMAKAKARIHAKTLAIYC